MRSDLPSVEPVLQQIIRPVVAAGSIPVVCVAVGNARTGERVTVCEGPEGQGGPPVTARALFDLASLSKVVALLPVVLELVRRGQLGLDDLVCRHLPAFAGGGAGVTLRHLLAHTAGLRVTPRYYRNVRDADALRDAVLAESPEVRPGTRTLYTDIGFLVLGFLVEAVTRSSLDALARELVFEPLELSELIYRPGEALAGRCVPTEIIDGVPVVGVVHDRNARALGEVAGHAGLFGTIAAVGDYASQWADADSPWLGRERREAITRQTPTPGPARGLGWVLNDDGQDFMTPAWPSAAAGHTGFTGTTLSFDLASGAWLVILTNALNVGRDRAPLTALRRAIHSACAPFLSFASR